MPLKSMSGLHGCSLQPSQRQESHGISRESSSRLGKIRSQEAECLECRLCSVMRFICTFEVPSLRNRSQQSSRPHGEWRKTPWPKMFFPGRPSLVPGGCNVALSQSGNTGIPPFMGQIMRNQGILWVPMGTPISDSQPCRCFAPAVISERSDVQSRSRSGCTAEPDPPLLYSGPPSQT